MHQPKILIIEDSSRDYRQLAKLVAQAGYAPSPQITSLKAFTEWKQHFDLAIVDLELQGQPGNRDGRKIAAALKGKRPVIIHTNFPDTTLDRIADPAAYVLAMMKPSHLSAWQAQIRIALSGFYGSSAKQRFIFPRQMLNSHEAQAQQEGFKVPSGQRGGGNVIIPPASISYLRTKSAPTDKGKVFFVSDLGEFSRGDSLRKIMSNPISSANLLQIKSSCVVNYNRVTFYGDGFVKVTLNEEVYGKKEEKLTIGDSFRASVAEFFSNFH